MNTEIVIDLVKLVLPSLVAYVVWLTKSVLKQGHDLDAAFEKIRVLEDAIEIATDCQR